MKTKNARMEALLIVGTTLLSHELCEKDETHRNSHSSENEQLEEACWNGLLQSMLPEMFPAPTRENPFYLWEITSTPSFLEIDLGEAPAVAESHFSIFPSSFLSTLSKN